MKKWSKGIEINAPIEDIWKLFDGSLEDMQKIMPNLVENEPIQVVDDGGTGSVYRQKFQDKRRVQSYDIETLEYLNEDDEKKLKIGFSLANMFDITSLYELEKRGENKTYFRYTSTNQPKRLYLKLMLLFASNRIVADFVKRVKKIAEREFADLKTQDS